MEGRDYLWLMIPEGQLFIITVVGSTAAGEQVGPGAGERSDLFR